MEFWYAMPVTLNFLLFILFFTVCSASLVLSYNDATSVLYTARLVNIAFCIQPMVR